jgi:hypothetical protein
VTDPLFPRAPVPFTIFPGHRVEIPLPRPPYNVDAELQKLGLSMAGPRIPGFFPRPGLRRAPGSRWPRCRAHRST